MRVGIVGQKDNSRAAAIAADVAARLVELDVDLVVDEVTAGQFDGTWPDAAPPLPAVAAPVDRMSDCDLVVSIGGDGTFLFAAGGAESTPVMGVNLGEVGFLNAVSPDEAVPTVEAAVAEYQSEGRIETQDVPRLGASGDGWTLPPALNEVVVQGPRRGHGGGADIEVRVDGSVYTTGRADGVIVATPTGSTAYNLSEDGPLVHPATDAFVVTEMCGEEPMPPLVVEAGSTVTVGLASTDDGYVVSDGRSRRELDAPERVRVALADQPVRIAGPPLDFFAALGKLD